MQRRDEILAKKAKLAELKRQRELRASQVSASRQSIGSSSDQLTSPISARADNRRDIETLINSLVGEGKTASSTSGGASSPAGRASRPNSVLSAGAASTDASDTSTAHHHAPRPRQNLTAIPLTTIYELPPSPVKEVYSYSKGVQTNPDLLTRTSPHAGSRPPRTVPSSDDEPQLEEEDEDEPVRTANKRRSRREREREEELRDKICREIQEELEAARDLVTEGVLKPPSAQPNFPARHLTLEELDAATQSPEFMDFIDRSTKVIEKALDQEYDILNDYTLLAQDLDDDDDDDALGNNTGGKGRRKVRQVAQFFDARWSKKRMVSSLDFSPKSPELLLASYTKNPSAPHEPDGVVQVWNRHLHDRPEFVFTAQSDIVVARFSPFHPNLIVGGAYNGQVMVWDTRSKQAPVSKSPLTGSGHTHPVYALDLVGTQNANNIISISTDGAVCGWNVDMLAQPLETLTLTDPKPAKIDDLSPLCLAFPHADPTFFLVGSEEGTIWPCHRYDRAGAKAGVDATLSYKGHAAPIMSLAYHPAQGPVDLSDLVLSASLDWSVKLWKIRPPAGTSVMHGGPTATAATAAAAADVVGPIMEFVRENVVYDTRWSPVKPGIFGLVDGAGWLELWDLTVETEEPVARITPSAPRKDSAGGGGTGARTAAPLIGQSLNKLAWEHHNGRRIATAGINGVVTIFEVGPDLGGKENVTNEEWAKVKKLVHRVEALGVTGATMV